MNNWNFTGNLGKDAEQRYTPGGDVVVQFSVAIKSGYGDKAQTTWARCSLWGKRGEADLAIMSGELVRFLPHLMLALGGEGERQKNDYN